MKCVWLILFSRKLSSYPIQWHNNLPLTVICDLAKLVSHIIKRQPTHYSHISNSQERDHWSEDDENIPTLTYFLKTNRGRWLFGLGLGCVLLLPPLVSIWGTSATW